MFLLSLLSVGFLVSIGVSPDPEGIDGTLADVRIRDLEHVKLNLPTNAFPYTPGCMCNISIFLIFLILF